MSLNHSILGLLNIQPMAGYDLKKIMQDSPFMHWSGNNNQIYKALTELSREKLVSMEVLHREDGPSKKLYALTADGQAELRRWAKERPESLQTKRNFFLQLAFSEGISDAELAHLLDQYEEETRGQLLIEREMTRRGRFLPDGSSRGKGLWEAMYARISETLEEELQWTGRLREKLRSGEIPFGNEPEKNNEKEGDDFVMKHRKITCVGGSYVELLAPGALLEKEQDGLELISLCAANDTAHLMVPGACLSPEFLRLSTGVAGAILQKFANYGVRAAFVIGREDYGERFAELMREAKKGKIFAAFETADEAERWLFKEVRE